MLRIGFFLTAASFVWSLSAGTTNGFYGLFSPNSTASYRIFSDESVEPYLGFTDLDFAAPESDTLKKYRILMFDYCSYDSVYPSKIRKFLTKSLPGTDFKTFQNGSPNDLEKALADRQIVFISYPSRGENDRLQSFGNLLKNFIRNGGAVIFTGTHEFDVLRQLDLLDLDYGYYFADPKFHRPAFDHPITEGIPSDFSLTNYAYPLDVSDHDFVSLLDINGYPSVGYKTAGRGAVVYLGMEYYYDEPISTRILVNSVQWAGKFSKAKPAPERAKEKPTSSRPRRLTLRLAPHEFPAKDSISLNIYPNPFWDKADIEIAIGDPTQVSLEINDQTGQLVASMLSKKTLAQGKHVLELPTLPPGVYFVKCKYGETTTVRRIVKISS